MNALPGCCVDRKYGHPGACTDATCMRIPDGKTCGDCKHGARCSVLYGVKPTNTTCDFFPRRFLLRGVLEGEVTP